MSASSTDHSGGRRRTLYGTTHLPGHPVGPPRSALTPLQQPLPGEHAVVLGASMGGLLAAKVLADFYETVTVVERDVLVAALGNPTEVDIADGGEPVVLDSVGLQRLLDGLRTLGIEAEHFPWPPIT